MSSQLTVTLPKIYQGERRDVADLVKRDDWAGAAEPAAMGDAA